jgi:ubiquinone/menaquinone biosynthesis C-methylase UbiE
MRVHFDEIADDYHLQAAGTQQAVYDDLETWITPLITGKVVLDVGNGGKFAYDTGLPSAVTALDISEKMLAKISDTRVVRVVGDALKMDGIDDHSVDVVVLCLMLHHMAGRTRLQSLATLRQVLTSARRTVRPGGCVVVTETVATPMFSAAQRLIYPASHAFLAPRVGMLYFFSPLEMESAFRDVFGAVALQTRPHPIKGWLDPFPGTFPGRIKIPAWALPMRFWSYLAKF